MVSSPELFNSFPGKSDKKFRYTRNAHVIFIAHCRVSPGPKIPTDFEYLNTCSIYRIDDLNIRDCISRSPLSLWLVARQIPQELTEYGLTVKRRKSRSRIIFFDSRVIFMLKKEEYPGPKSPTDVKYLNTRSIYRIYNLNIRNCRSRSRLSMWLLQSKIPCVLRLWNSTPWGSQKKWATYCGPYPESC